MADKTQEQLIDKLLKDYKGPESFWGESGLFSQLKKKIWEYVIPSFDYPSEVRRVIYTTNAIESLNRSLRKVIKTKGAFPNDASILKLFYLALPLGMAKPIANISKKWTMPIRTWKAALSQFTVRFEGRLPI